MKSALLILVLAGTASADVNFGATKEGENIVGMYTGAEHGLVVGANYARVMPHDIVLSADATLGFAEADPGDYRLRATFAMPLVGLGKWAVIGAVSPTLRGTHNAVANMVDIGGDLSILAGRYTRRWFAAAELGFDTALATHITNSDEYRMAYPEARDGWYGTPGGNFRYGVQAGVTFARYDVILRAGQLRDVGGDQPMLPFYATLGVSGHF